MSTAASLRRAGLFSRLWSAYVVALKERPMRTKMITGAVTTMTADLIAQLVVERKALLKDEADLKQSGEIREPYDVVRTLRLTFYGGVMHAPLAHTWFGILHRVQLKSQMTTLAARLSLDVTIWSPFIISWFTTMISLLEGKNLEDIRQKFALQFFPTWRRAICVFGPTQVFNLTCVPPDHRTFVLQTVGLAWNVYLSWLNNWNNKKIDQIAAPVSTTDSAGP